MNAIAAPAALEKIVIVTRKTRLAELIERFNTVGQARFYIEHAGGNFNEYLEEDAVYQRALERIRHEVDHGLKLQIIERALVPTYMFTDKDLIITAGGDGLVANTAKYVGSQPVVAVNVDPVRNDGVLLPFRTDDVRAVVASVLSSQYEARRVTLAEATTMDGQKLLAFNDFFVGARSHVSARYDIALEQRRETQSSSGVIVSTGAGSTGWLSSVFNMMDGVSGFAGAGTKLTRPHLPLDTSELAFVVREPFVSKHSSASMVCGLIPEGNHLVMSSLMPSGGCLFSDGIEDDYVAFNSGTTIKIGVAAQRARLVSRRVER